MVEDFKIEVAVSALCKIQQGKWRFLGGMEDPRLIDPRSRGRPKICPLKAV